ncbi:hypothetical protein J6590_013136 [Homalodisca vitripennis]|nr:hypothetical protein J6590_013136 [Homalodisca vitripennis]
MYRGCCICDTNSYKTIIALSVMCKVATVTSSHLNEQQCAYKPCSNVWSGWRWWGLVSYAAASFPQCDSTLVVYRDLHHGQKKRR